MNAINPNETANFRTTQRHRLLPLPAQALLRTAAATPDSPRDPIARQRAVEHAIRRVRRDYPAYFREEAQHDA